MTQNKDHWIKSPWTISIGTAIFSLLLSMGYDFFKDKPILTTIWSILKWIGNLFWTILNFDLKVWWVIIVVILFVLIIYLIDKLKKEATFKPDFYSYREEESRLWKWTWEWQWNKRKRAWMITDMKAHCPNCDTPMIDNSNMYGYYFDCPRCDFKAENEQCDQPHKIERIILDNIDRERNKTKNSP